MDANAARNAKSQTSNLSMNGSGEYPVKSAISNMRFEILRGDVIELALSDEMPKAWTREVSLTPSIFPILFSAFDGFALKSCEEVENGQEISSARVSGYG
jgi:hypothetical protein